MISFHCFKLDALASGPRRKRVKVLSGQRYSLFLSLKKSDALLILRGFVQILSPLECASSFSLSMCFFPQYFNLN